MEHFGSMAWGARHGGRLTARDRFILVSSAFASRLKRRLRGASPAVDTSRLDLDALQFPDSALVSRVTEVCEAAYEPWLLNHCYRTYLWGGLVGQAEQVPIDREALLVSSLCHDLGLTPVAEADCECFAIRGAYKAQALLSELGAHALAPRAAQSIAVHLNIAVGRGEPLDYLVHQGASIDVVGWGKRKVAPARAAVLAAHPLAEFGVKFVDLLAAEAHAHPGGRLAAMVRFGFFDLIRVATSDGGR
jgi:hypothetical protein